MSACSQAYSGESDRLVVVGRRAVLRELRDEARHRARRRCARTSAPSRGCRRSGRGRRRRRRAARSRDRRTASARAAPPRPAGAPAVRRRRGAKRCSRPRKPAGSLCRRASIQPAASPWSWLPADTISSPCAPNARPTSAKNGAAISTASRCGASRSSSASPRITSRSTPRQRLEQRRAQVLPSQQVVALGLAEVQIGDDERPHARRLVCPPMPPLDGILVADFSRVLAGPLAAMLLGDLGADVIKVERPDGGDDTRAWGPPWRDGVVDVLPRAQPQQALDRARPQGLRRPRARAHAGRARRRDDRVVPARADRRVRARRRHAARRSTRASSPAR